MKVKLIEADGVDASGWQVSAIRGTELLVARSGKKPKWVKQEEVVLDA